MFYRSYWENQFRAWAKPPTKTEEYKREDATIGVKSAVLAFLPFKDKDISVFVRGSYKNGTSVRIANDVDVCVCCSNSIAYELSDGGKPADYGLSEEPATYTYKRFKADVELALKQYFGLWTVFRGNKVFDVHGTTRRVDADVVACFEYRSYHDRSNYDTGIAFLTDTNHGIVNWPKQDYEKGCLKDEQTGGKYKKIVRVLKSLRDVLAAHGAYKIPIGSSFLIECLVSNIPNENFGYDRYVDDVWAVLAYLFNNTLTADKCKDWVEVNGRRYLLRSGGQWTIENALGLISDLWDFVGFE